MNDPRDLLAALSQAGPRQAWWWLLYQGQLRTGVLRWRTPSSAWDWASLARFVQPEHRPQAERYLAGESVPRFFFEDPRSLAPELARLMGPGLQMLSDAVLLASAGRYRLWEDGYHNLGRPPAWNTNPLTGRSAGVEAHWSAVEERGTGDAKGLWELSRFAVAFTLVRYYAVTEDPQASGLFWELFDSWTQANPPNCGPQWVSGQEVALRAMAWAFALVGFWRADLTTRLRREQMAIALRTHAQRIAVTLAYGRAQNNNHLLAEAAALYTVGALFPWMRESSRWRTLGRDLIRTGVEHQFLADGSYLQYSTNYQRLAVHVLLWVLRLGEIHGDPFPNWVYARMGQTRDRLAELADPMSGGAPNLGHNDGALVLPLTSCDFEDYRPVVQDLCVLVDRRPGLPVGPWDEESLWLFGTTSPGPHAGCAGEPSAPPVPARSGGVIVLGGGQGRAVVRCSQYRTRPAHADQLHVDLWSWGENVACDPGTYLYSGEAPWYNPFTHAGFHNTLTVDGQDQMRRLGRFLWGRVAQARVEILERRPRGDVFQGSHDGYRRLGVLHRRSVARLGQAAWVVVDDVLGQGKRSLRLHWLLPDGKLAVASPRQEPAGEPFRAHLALKAQALGVEVYCSESCRWSLARAGALVSGQLGAMEPAPLETRGWRSLHYGSKIPANSLAFECSSSLPARWVTLLFVGEGQVKRGGDMRDWEIGVGSDRFSFQLERTGSERVFADLFPARPG